MDEPQLVHKKKDKGFSRKKCFEQFSLLSQGGM